MKTCGICKQEKNSEEFGIDKRHPDGLKWECKKCRKEYGKKYREKYGKILARRKKKKYWNNHEEELLKRRKYIEENEDKIRKSKQKWYQKNIDKKQKYQRDYYKKHKDEILAYQEKNKDKIKQQDIKRKQTIKGKMFGWKGNAKARNISWDIDLQYLESLPLVCYYTGVDLVLEPGKENTVSLDRLDSSKDYTKDNVVFCCWYVNEMKNDYSIDDFVRRCENIINNKHRFMGAK